MSRTVKLANAEIFEALDRYCLTRNEPLASSGETRRIWVNRAGYHIAETSERVKALRFGQSRSVTYWRYDKRYYLATVGIEASAESEFLREIPVTAGIATVLLSDLKPPPNALPIVVKNVVDAYKWDSESYEGHDAQAVLSLYPNIRAFAFEQNLELEEVDRLIFRVTLAEVLESTSWIDESLGLELGLLVDEVPVLMPVALLSEVIFDQDPQALFMALYRYLEGVYAFKSTSELRSALGIETGWIKVAERLSDQLRWRPREAEALVEVLRLADENSLAEIQGALARADLGKADQASASSLYELRNRIVHYRLGAERPDIAIEHWRDICAVLCRIIRDVYTSIHLRTSLESL
ncbi:hypothetical protein [Curtobacterium sp. 8I-2]|uniref:hypothetical protein n=1 Tax=Curtobacterium sp. 8I-2 TaxID=2653136 RepID=UPI0012F4200C|nr:hypothetical protein [Curtobacterium sp. 8I-2]VXA97636.1 conserved hypothetical protein [Curtobacterium sp. 8I-2]